MINEKGQLVVNVGLDVSYNSTGICVLDTSMKVAPRFIVIASGKLKEEDRVKEFEYVMYERRENHKKMLYGQREINKVLDSQKVSALIEEIVNRNRVIIAKAHNTTVDKVWLDIRIEGNVLGTFGMRYGRKVDNQSDMITITAIVKSRMSQVENASIWPIGPTAIKAYWCGKIHAKKHEMIPRFNEMFPHITLVGKIDDIIDATAIAFHVEPWFRERDNHHETWKQILANNNQPI